MNNFGEWARPVDKVELVPELSPGFARSLVGVLAVTLPCFTLAARAGVFAVARLFHAPAERGGAPDAGR
jgi:hypothetical protein